jgi:hypothetical protein
MADGGARYDDGGGTMLWTACAFIASVLVMYAAWVLGFQG